jgi:hypothetical protein
MFESAENHGKPLYFPRDLAHFVICMNKCAILFLAAGLAGLTVAVAEAEPSVSVLENTVLYVRPGRVTENLPEQLRSLQPTNQTVGTVLDLRFADGDSGVAAAAKLFSAKKLPLVILVDGETRGAAAELALDLRAVKAGIIIGSTNAPEKISPDIAVKVSADAEKDFLENPFAPPATNAITSLSPTNDLMPFVDHVNEAQLVRDKIKDGDESDAPTARPEPVQPVIRDPALARAVDLLKALAILKQSRG